jgi:hypothetical protein
MKRKFLFSVILIGFSLLAVLLFPYRTTCVPEWKVRVIDEKGAPIARIWVNQSWENYSLRPGKVYSETRYTDTDGWVDFPERTMRASLRRRAWGPIREVLKLGIHASTGNHAMVLASDTNRRGVLVYNGGNIPGQLLIVRCN